MSKRIMENHLKKYDDINNVFGVSLKNMGFVPNKGGREWYALKNGKLFFSLLFVSDSVETDIYFRIQPLCTHIIYPVERYYGAKSDLRNSGINALGYYLYTHCSDNRMNTDSLMALGGNSENKVAKLKVLFDNVVVKLFEKINDYSDAIDMIFPGTVYDSAAFAYLSGDSESFYNNELVKSSFRSSTINLPQRIPFYQAKQEFSNVMSEALEKSDMSIIGKHLAGVEAANIESLKKSLPALFKSIGDIRPILSDEYINTCAVTEVRRSATVNIAASFDNIELIYEPMPNVPTNPDVSPEESKKALVDVIRKYFSEELLALGFTSRKDGLEWHKLIDNCLYQRIYFSLHPYIRSINIFYETITLGDEVVINNEYEGSMAKNEPSKELARLFGMPYLNEIYSNPFNNGQQVLNWQIRRLKMMLRYVVYPYMEATKTLEGLCRTEANNISASCFLSDYGLIESEVKERYKESAYDWNVQYDYSLDKKPYKITRRSKAWENERTRVLHVGFYHDDLEYMRDYFLKCREINLRYLREEIPELF